MASTSITRRLIVTAILLVGLVDVSHRLAVKLAAYTAPSPAAQARAVIQGRRLAIDRLQQASALMESDPNHAQEILMRVVKHARERHIRTRAAARLGLLALSDWPDDHRRAFLQSIFVPSLESARTHGVPPSVTLAQAALESGWGRSALARKHNNLFGIKGAKARDDVEFPTLEFGPKGVHIVRASFRRFDTAGAAIAHHGALLATDPRYREARQHRGDWRAYLTAIAPVYASDPNYVRSASRIIQTYRLDRWDALVGAFTPKS
jgi:flagellum-specific peptidoglycan hydrolase FlgJ